MISQRQRRLLKALHGRKGREKHGLFLVEGPRLIREALEASWPLGEVFFDPDASTRGVAELVEALAGQGMGVVAVTARELSEAADTVTPQGIVATARMSDSVLEAWRPVDPGTVLVVAGVQEPGNVGALLRTAEAYALSTVLLPCGTADPFNPKAVRGAMGAHFRLRLIREMEADRVVDGLRDRGYHLLASVSRGGIDPEKALEPGKPWALLVGGEGAGLAQVFVDAADQCVTIQTPGRAESLNVVVATGILLDRLRFPGR